MSVPVGKIGKILDGVESGKFIQVLDDKDSTGGYLILISSSSDMKSGHDDWVANLDELQKYFEESKWNVSWNS